MEFTAAPTLAKSKAVVGSTVLGVTEAQKAKESEDKRPWLRAS